MIPTHDGPGDREIGGTTETATGLMRTSYAEGRATAERDCLKGTACFIAICGVISPGMWGRDDEREQAMMNAYAAGYNNRLCELLPPGVHQADGSFQVPAEFSPEPAAASLGRGGADRLQEGDHG